MRTNNVTLAVAVVAGFFGGMAVGESHTSREVPATIAALAQPAPEAIHFPSQYVNQGVEATQDWPTF